MDWLVRNNSRTPELVTLTGSPELLSADSDGFYTVDGGTVTAIGISRNGVSAINIGVIAGQVHAQRGDQIQIVHAGAPTVYWFGEIKE